MGAGYFARFHHAAWARIAGARLTAIADRDWPRAQEAADAVG
ncbi:MAG: gfo/Idh/MocA family oxidoreductase, partial [Pseudomonadota bacterium]